MPYDLSAKQYIVIFPEVNNLECNNDKEAEYG